MDAQPVAAAAVFSTSIASSKSCAVSPSIVTIACPRKSDRPEKSAAPGLLGEGLGFRDDLLRKAVRQVVHSNDDLDVDARLPEKAEALDDLAAGDSRSSGKKKKK